VHQHFTASLIRKTLDVFVIAALLAGVALSPVPVAYAATFTVDNAGDAGDANPGNGSCATAGGVCTLRAAIEESNALAAGAPTTFISTSGAAVYRPSLRALHCQISTGR